MGLRPADPAQQPTRHPCSQTGCLRGWTQTRRDLGTRRSRCSPGSRGTGGRSQRGLAAGRAARRTPAAPVAGPPCPLGCRSPSPGGCLGQMQGRGVRSKEKQTTPAWASLPAGRRGHQFSQAEASGGLVSQCHFQAILKPTGSCHRLRHPLSSGSPDQLSCPSHKPRPPPALPPQPLFLLAYLLTSQALPRGQPLPSPPPPFSSQQAA